MNKNEVRIYLKKDIKTKLDYLANLCDMPTSKLLRVLIEDDIFIDTIDRNITLIESVKSKQKSMNENQMEFNFNDTKQ